MGTLTAIELAQEIVAFCERTGALRGTTALDPGHRRQFHWPPHPISYDYHVLASDWSGKATLDIDGETFDVDIAKTPHGTFGRIRTLWNEAKGKTEAEVLTALRKGVEPLFARQRAIGECLEQKARFAGHIRDLEPLSLLKLLFCDDRDVANEARTEIETRASLKVFGHALIVILNDRCHPMRRSAQWCVLDLFEDIRSFCDTDDLESRAIQAMKDLIMGAEDDFARTIYKAGVVLGGHLPGEKGGPVLIECLSASSKVGRRAAIHGLFHVVEWHPDSKAVVLAALHHAAAADPEPVLRQYALSMAADIANGNLDHVSDPLFPEEER
ncbi:MAG TPA: hypothetical protein PKA27_09220 [Fimbriimonadaceae bacterium]|nr:hypothetical protein [Fimbriimonadaceae bacterium]